MMGDPNNPNPQMRAPMLGPNGQPMMGRPPSSHPIGPMGQPLNPQQLEMMRQQQGQMMNGQFAGQPGPGQMMQGQQPPQGVPSGQPPNMTPRPGNMAPPPAPANAQGGTQPSSPAQPPAPPTPSQGNKAKPGAKKGDNKKVSVCVHATDSTVLKPYRAQQIRRRAQITQAKLRRPRQLLRRRSHPATQRHFSTTRIWQTASLQIRQCKVSNPMPYRLQVLI